MTDQNRQSNESADDRRVSLEEAVSRLTTLKDVRFAKVFEHGSLVVEIFAPHEVDIQQPHARDEVYIVMRGSGQFLNGGSRQEIVPGDFLFVPAGIEHRFENFTDDLLLWVIFYGPEGGES